MRHTNKTRAPGTGGNTERFSSTPPNSVPRSAFDRSYSHKTTFNSAELIPIFCDEVLPGDTMSLRPSFLARLTTPITPYMDGIHLDWQFFAIPLRLVWDNFTKMMGERTDPADHNDYTIPQMVAPASVGHQNQSLSDYLTLPTHVPDYTHSALFHRAYYSCWNHWFRDENLQDSLPIPLDDGPDLASEYVLQKRGKRKDYITGSLPFAQKGEAIHMPLGASAPLGGNPGGIAGEPPLFTVATDSSFDAFNITIVGGNSHTPEYQGATGGSSGADIDLDWHDPSIDLSVTAPSGLAPFADLSAAEGATINEMRQAIAIQHLLEADARGGTRYVEHNLVHFGVSVPDLRLFRPELLGTGSMKMDVHQVANHSTISPLGILGAYAQTSQVGRGFVKTFDEHMIVLGLISCRAELTYQQGLNRMFSRKTRYEFFYPHLAHIGEQAVLSREIYTDGTGDEDLATGDFAVWGYQPRYEEYRHRQSVVSGQMRSNDPINSLDTWHLALDFDSRPVLNDAFIVEDPPIERIVVIPTAPEIIMDSFFRIKHVRPMPKFGTPGLLRF